MKNFAIITKTTLIKSNGFDGSVFNTNSTKVTVYRFLGIPFFRSTTEIEKNA